MKEEKSIVGIGLLLFAWIKGGWRIFTIKELKSKPMIRKESGMISFPLETQEEKDGSMEGTLSRLIDEEVGNISEQVCIYEMVSKKFLIHKGIEIFYFYGIFGGDYRQNFSPKDDDIVYAGWWTLEELLAFTKIRVEVLPILQHFMKNGGLNNLLIKQEKIN